MKLASYFLILVLGLLGESPAQAVDSCAVIFAKLSKGVDLTASRGEKIAFWDEALRNKAFRLKIEAPAKDEGYWVYELQTAKGLHVASVEFDFEGKDVISIEWQATETAYRRKGAQTYLAGRIVHDFPEARTVTSSLQDTNLASMRAAVAGGASDIDAFKKTAVYLAYEDAGFSVVDKIIRYEREDGSTGYIFFVSKPRS